MNLSRLYFPNKVDFIIMLMGKNNLDTNDNISLHKHITNKWLWHEYMTQIQLTYDKAFLMIYNSLYFLYLH